MAEEEHKALLVRLREGRARMIREARLASGLTQAQVAEAAGTSQQTVDRIERGATDHSRAYEAVRAAVGLPPEEGFNYNRIKKNLAELRQSSEEELRKFQALRRTEELPTPDDSLPVFGFLIDNDIRTLSRNAVDTIPRIFPVERVVGAYGVIVLDNDMLPALRPGDVAIINPHIPAGENCEVLLSRQDGDYRKAMFRTLVERGGFHWQAKTWNPDSSEQLAKTDWPRAELVVAKINRKS